MKWPWQRKTYTSIDGTVTLGEVEFLRACLKDERSRYDALATKHAELTGKYVSLKMTDASELPTRFRLPAESTEVADSPSMNRIPLGDADPMRELIHARAGSNYRMRNMMLSQLAVDRADGRDDDAIREAILTGVPSDGVPS